MMARKEPKLTGAAIQVHKHPYRGDGVPDHQGHDRCGDCGLDEGHRVHKLDRLDQDATELGQRITGERQTGERT